MFFSPFPVPLFPFPLALFPSFLPRFLSLLPLFPSIASSHFSLFPLLPLSLFPFLFPFFSTPFALPFPLPFFLFLFPSSFFLFSLFFSPNLLKANIHPWFFVFAVRGLQNYIAFDFILFFSKSILFCRVILVHTSIRFF